jgi:hypothetical protein
VKHALATTYLPHARVITDLQVVQPIRFIGGVPVQFRKPDRPNQKVVARVGRPRKVVAQ